MQDPNILLTILSRMAQKPEVKFDKLFQKLYNTDLWMMAYESIASKPGNMTHGADDRTVDGMSMERIQAADQRTEGITIQAQSSPPHLHQKGQREITPDRDSQFRRQVASNRGEVYP